MRIWIIADDDQRNIILQQVQNALPADFFYSPDELPRHTPAPALLDLRFDGAASRLSQLISLNSELLILNEVIQTIDELDAAVVRINAWPVFFERPVIEAACNNQQLKKQAEEIFALLGKKTEWVADVPGLISPRILAGIINEACYAAEESISTPQEIDIAMKLGVNYPAGPFEWAEKIGWENIALLLQRLSGEHSRYTPCDYLLQKAGVT